MELVPLELTVDPPKVVIDTAQGAEAWVLADLKAIAEAHPGRYRVALMVGRHTLGLGPAWNVNPDPEAVALLAEFGHVEVVPA